MIDQSDFINRYYLKADLVMDKPLHVGQGISVYPTGTDLPVIKDQALNPFIPGSSIKGVVRCNLERLLRTIEDKGERLGVRRTACDPFGDRCVTNEDAASLKREAGSETDYLEKVWDKTCLVCRLFGSQQFASRVFFKDAAIDPETMVRTQIRDGVAIDRDLGAARKGMKYDYEVAPAGVRFGFEAIFENLEDWEAGLLLLVMRMWEKGELAVGGKVSSGLGWGRLEGLSMEMVDAKDLIDYLLDGTGRREVDRDGLLQAFRRKIGG